MGRRVCQVAPLLEDLARRWRLGRNLGDPLLEDGLGWFLYSIAAAHGKPFAQDALRRIKEQDEGLEPALK